MTVRRSGSQTESSTVDNPESVKYPGGSDEENRDTLLSEMPVYRLIQEAKARNNK